MTAQTDKRNETPGARSDAASKAGDETRKMRDDATHEAQSLKDRASQEAHDRAEGAKDSMAEEVSSVGRAFRAASDELREGSPQEKMFSSMAEGLADFANSLRGRSVPDLVHDVSDFGRRNPAAFLGGAALLGFAAVRAARATQEGHDDHRAGGYGAERPGAGYAGARPSATATRGGPVASPAAAPDPTRTTTPAPSAGLPRNEDT